MAQEVDQAAIDVIKTLLESREGERFFEYYLRCNLKLDIFSSLDMVTVDLIFNNFIVASVTKHKMDMGCPTKTN